MPARGRHDGEAAGGDGGARKAQVTLAQQIQEIIAKRYNRPSDESVAAKHSALFKPLNRFRFKETIVKKNPSTHVSVASKSHETTSSRSTPSVHSTYAVTAMRRGRRSRLVSVSTLSLTGSCSAIPSSSSTWRSSPTITSPR